MRSPCNVDAKLILHHLCCQILSSLWWAGGCERRNVAQAGAPCVQIFRSHFGSRRDPLHLPSRQPYQDSFRVRFLFAVYIAWSLLLLGLSSSVGNLVVLDLVRYLRWNMGIQLGESQPRAGLAGKTFPRPKVTLPDPSPAGGEGIKGNRSLKLLSHHISEIKYGLLERFTTRAIRIEW